MTRIASRLTLPLGGRTDSWTRDGGTWPGTERESLRLRETDRLVRRGGQNPLSVSSDKIAVTAMRCAGLLFEHSRRGKSPPQEVNRLDGLIVEAYPAAAFRAWGVSCAGYKGKTPEHACGVSKLGPACKSTIFRCAVRILAPHTGNRSTRGSSASSSFDRSNGITSTVPSSPGSDFQGGFSLADRALRTATRPAATPIGDAGAVSTTSGTEANRDFGPLQAERFPDCVAVKPYLRTTPQPQS